MELEDRSGNLGSDRAEESALYNVFLCFAVGNEQDLFCLHDRAHTHGDRLARNVAFLFKEASVCLDGRLMQVNHVGRFFKDGSRLIKADMTVKTDAEQLDMKYCLQLQV